MDDGNATGRNGFTGRDIAVLVAIAIAGLGTVRWLLRHPENAREIDARILLGTQRCCLGISDGCRKLGDGFRYVADKAGTQFNEIRSA
jgi:hypothetical protein